MKNEEVYFKLIHNTYDESKRQSDKGAACMKHMAVTETFKEVFGQHVNKDNLIQFLSNEAVQHMW